MGDGPTRYFPVFLDLSGRLVVAVGEGEAIARKAERMTTYGADVVVITPTVTERLLELEGEGVLTVEQRAYEPGDLEGAFLLVAAGVDAETREALVAEAESRRILVSVPGGSHRNSYITPSTITRGGLQIAVSTAGIAPSLARAIRRDLADEYGPEWGRFVELLADVKLATADRPNTERSAIVAWAVDSDLSQRFFDGEELSAEDVVTAYDVEHPAEEATEGDADVAAEDDADVAVEEVADGDAAPEDAE